MCNKKINPQQAIDTIREKKFQEGIAMRNKAVTLIAEHAKKENYFNSEKLKKAINNLIIAIQP